jgi:hypothetical protein
MEDRMVASDRIIPALIALALLGAGASAASAQALPDSENGRYTFTQTAEGVLRKDTRTGQLSTCSRQGGNWACYAAPDERAALDAEIGRLQAENERLRAQLGERQADAGKAQGSTQGPKGEPLLPRAERNPDGTRKLEIPLPSDQDLDRAMSFLEKVWRRLIEMTGRVQKDVQGKV